MASVLVWLVTQSSLLFFFFGSAQKASTNQIIFISISSVQIAEQNEQNLKIEWMEMGGLTHVLMVLAKQK